MFWGYWLPTPFGSFPFTSYPCVIVCHSISTGLYLHTKLIGATFCSSAVVFVTALRNSVIKHWLLFSEWMMNDSDITETLWRWFRKTWVCNKYKVISVNPSSNNFTIFSGFKFRMSGTLTLAWLQSGLPRHTCCDNALIWKGHTAPVG